MWMRSLVLILLLISFIGGCAFGPEEEPGDLRERSMDWPSPVLMERDKGPRTPEEQR
jgi:hypothetical protein